MERVEKKEAGEDEDFFLLRNITFFHDYLFEVICNHCFRKK